MVVLVTGDHVLLDSRSFASFPADPKLVTVRTAAAGDRESRDSRPAQLSHQMLEEIRTGMMLNEVELSSGPAGPGSRNASDSVSLQYCHLFTLRYSTRAIFPMSLAALNTALCSY